VDIVTKLEFPYRMRIRTAIGFWIFFATCHATRRRERFMKYAASWTFAFIALGLTTLAPAPAYADAVGPYYATPSWDQTLPASTRFIVLTNFDSAAVLDRETGLVWEKIPLNAPVDWGTAVLLCMEAKTGGRSGWRLPTIYELNSLLDVVAGGLPAGHPFTVNTGFLVYFWSTTNYPSSNIFAMIRGFPTGATNFGSATKTGPSNFAWCVRGGVGGNSDPS
jgi:hypothetical protein